ncbi:MAG: adenosylcobinamide-phosphate synthase CbiB, partial [Comamonadaceae bacterium]|nr:adenosylcobinamide-phosphate synthase CbiB [Comamonadaceae bacterium]
AWLAGAAWFTGAAWLLQAWLLSQPAWLAALALGLFLKPMLAWAMLHDEVLAVEGALTQSLAAGRQQLARLVSRDVTRLDATQVRESAIESLAENLNDSVIAPLFWFTLLGLPGAVLYRYANTADAMWGYHGVRPLGGAPRQWAWAGKWAARADDVLSWLPARLTALLLALAAGGRLPWRRLPREAAQTPSPNSGWPMAAMALALGVHLRKPGAYTLNPQGCAPGPADTLRACAIGSRCALAATLLACAALMVLMALRA